MASTPPKAAASPATTSASAASGSSMRILDACRAIAAAKTPRRQPQTPENASVWSAVSCDKRMPMSAFSSKRRGTSTSLLTFVLPLLAKGQLTVLRWVSKNLTSSRGHGNTYERPFAEGSPRCFSHRAPTVSIKDVLTPQEPTRVRLASGCETGNRHLKSAVQRILPSHPHSLDQESR